MSGLQGILPGSDPNTPNTFIQSPQQLAYQQQLADALSREGSSTAPIASPWQGAANLAKAIAGAIGSYKVGQAQRLRTADAAADQSNVFNQRGMLNDPSEANIPATPGQTTPALQANDAANDAVTDAADNGVNPRAALVAALNGGSAPAPTSANPTLAAALAAPSGGPSASGPMALAAALGGGTPYGTANVNGGAMAPYQAAIAKIESGGNYGAVGPTTSSGDRAYGKYQVMGANIPQWTQAALGRAMTPQEFLADPQAQDAVFNHQFGGYVQKYGPQDAASMWLTGRTLANGGAGATDQLGTNGQAYADQFTRNLGAAPASAAINAATTPHVPTWQEVQADNAQGTNAINAATNAGNGALPGASAYASGGVDRLSPDAATSPLARPAVPPSPTPTPSAGDLGKLDAAMSAQPTPYTGGLSGQPATDPAKSISPSHETAPLSTQPQYGDIGGLLRVASNPWSSPAAQQVSQALLNSQMPTPPTYGVIGKDPITGNEQYGWINPKTQTVTPVSAGAAADGGGALTPLQGSGSGGAPAAPGGAAQPGATTAQATVADALRNAAPNGLTPQGAAYLNAMEALGGVHADVARNARAIIDGQITIPDGFAATKPIDIAIRDAVLRAAPGFNQSLAAARSDMVKQFASHDNPGSAGNIIDASQKGLHHLNALADSADQLAPGDWSLINRAQQFGQEYSKGGNPPLKAFDLNRRALTDELTKLYKGGVASEGEVNGMLGDLQAAQTPGEMKAVFSKIGTLLTGVTDTYQSRWQSVFGPNSVYPIMQKENEDVLKRFQGPAPSAQGGAAPQTPPAPTSAAAAPPAPGARQAPNGNWYVPDPARPGKYLMVH